MEVIPQPSDRTVYTREYEPEIVPAEVWQAHSYTDGNISPRKRTCGFSRPVFWLSIALVFVIIVALVGGATGGTLAVKHAREQGQRLAVQKNPTGTLTITRTTTQTPSNTASASPTPDTGCPDRNHQIFDGPVNKYQILCNRDIGALDSNLNYVSNGVSNLIVSSIDECITACDNWNADGSPIDLGRCISVRFLVRDATDPWMAWTAGYCFLKNTTAGDKSVDSGVLAKAISS